MDDLYLIAHKVRGKPAFDIAIRIQIGDEEAWLIPTSGHRAYPYWHRSLSDIGIDLLPDGNWAYGYDDLEHTYEGLIGCPDDDLEDHYPSRPANEPTPTALSILAKLGLGRKAPTITRRV